MASGGSGEVEITSTSVSAGQKKYYFNLKQNDRGQFLKIAEVGSHGRSTIIIPDSGWASFRDMLSTFVDGSATAGMDIPEVPAAAATDAVESSGLQVWVEGLPWETTEQELLPYFQQVGAVTKCTINRNRSGRSQGTAIVRFEATSEAADAIAQLDGTEVGEDNKRRIHVRLDRFA